MTIAGARERIHASVTSWVGVEAHPHRFGGTEYVIGKREIGHIHGDRMVDALGAVRIGSTPASSVTAETSVPFPCVVTIISASPF